MQKPQDSTCDPSITSWVSSAHVDGTDFPLQNLPIGVMRERHSRGPWRAGVAIGDQILDLGGCAESGLLDALPPNVRSTLTAPHLNGLFALGQTHVARVRQRVHTLLRADALAADRHAARAHLLDTTAIELALPVAVGNCTDFFGSWYHATNVARLRDPEGSAPPHYPYAPLAYHAHASSIVLSDSAVVRPYGPRRGRDGAVYGPSERLDYEAELGFIIGEATSQGEPVEIGRARAHVAGVCLMNDWSARDVQAFEAHPLGPFLSKSFATSISPWVVLPEALEPFRVPAAARETGVPGPLPHLLDEDDQQAGAWSLVVEVWLSTTTMREERQGPVRLSASDARMLFWTPGQLVAHHTSNGCNLLPGDLLGSGTLSGPERDSRACLLEITRGGREPLMLPNGETRGYLHDGDEITLRAYGSVPGAARIGFGDCRGRIVAARAR